MPAMTCGQACLMMTWQSRQGRSEVYARLYPGGRRLLMSCQAKEVRPLRTCPTASLCKGPWYLLFVRC